MKRCKKVHWEVVGKAFGMSPYLRSACGLSEIEGHFIETQAGIIKGFHYYEDATEKFTDNPLKVTCKNCRKTKAWNRRPK